MKELESILEQRNCILRDAGINSFNKLKVYVNTEILLKIMSDSLLVSNKNICKQMAIFGMPVIIDDNGIFIDNLPCVKIR